MVTFISRSFADELFVIMEEKPDYNIEIINMSGIVESIYEAVKNGRRKKRIRIKENTIITECDNIESANDYFLAF